MWNGIQKTIALIGIGLFVLACLFPPVWRDGECGRVFAYLFVGRYVALQVANELRASIGWVELLFQLAAIGMGTVALILDTGQENYIARSKTGWIGVCVVVLIQFIGLYIYITDPNSIGTILFLWVAFGCSLPLLVLLALILGSSLEAVDRESQPPVLIRRFASCLQTVGRKLDFQKLSIPVQLISLLSGMFLLGVLGVAICKTERVEEMNYELITAIQAEDVKRATELLRDGANANTIQFQEEISDGLIGTCTYVHRKTPLGIAAAEGNLPLVKLLLEHGANPNLKSEEGKTPLDLIPSGQTLDPSSSASSVSSEEARRTIIRLLKAARASE